MVFTAKNAIDGMKANHYHGEWPYTSWGIARDRNRTYILAESQNVPWLNRHEDAVIHASYDWYRMPQDKRASNIASIVAQRMKLQLLGLDYGKEQETALKDNKAYFCLYSRDYAPKPDLKRSTDTLEVYDYSECMEQDYFTHGDPRMNLLVQEHYRWNAYMIAAGFIPATKEQMKTAVKDYSLRYHGNLTTFEGLFDFRAFRLEQWKEKNRDIIPPEEWKEALKNAEQALDVVKYDPQIMDEAWWFLNKSGYQIYERFQSSKKNSSESA